MPVVCPPLPAVFGLPVPLVGVAPEGVPPLVPLPVVVAAADPDEDDEDLGDEEDLSVAQPPSDEESAFDDFDDEFDDDFEEDEADPDWDHPDDDADGEPPPAKGPGKKK